MTRRIGDMIPMTDDPLGIPVNETEVTKRRILGAASMLRNAGFTPRIAGHSDFFAAAAAWAKSATLRKGLFVWGGFGSGKTHLMMTIRRFIPSMVTVNLGDPVHAEAIDLEKNREWCDAVMDNSVFLDDLGSEATLNQFGSVRERAGEFITYYHLHGRGSLYVTTNLSSEELERRYTMRVLSRLKDLTVPLHLKGPDKRNFSTPNKKPMKGETE